MSAKVLLGDSNFLKRLYEYDKDNMPDAMLKKLKKYIDNPKFVPDAVEKVSKVCDFLCLHVELWTNYGAQGVDLNYSYLHVTATAVIH